MKTYKEYTKAFKGLSKSTDHEANHIMADGYLCEIARLASIGKLNPLQVTTLVIKFQELHKWYG